MESTFFWDVSPTHVSLLSHDNDALMTFSLSLAFLLSPKKPLVFSWPCRINLRQNAGQSFPQSNSYTLYPYIPSILTLVYPSEFFFFSYLEPC